MEKPGVAIITINWNNTADTLECLVSLSRVLYQKKHIFVVDNGSSDDSVNVLKKYENSFNFTLLPNKENSGFSGGCNYGARYALKEIGISYILFLNNDTRVNPDFLECLIEEARQDTKRGVWAPLIYYADRPEHIWFAGGRIHWQNISRVGEHLQQLPATKYGKVYDTEFVTGCALLVKREVLERIGDMDERFFLYFEDMDLSLRAQKAGWKLGIVPSAKIWHKVSATTLTKLGSPALLYYHHRNGLLLTEKHGPFWVNVYKYYWAMGKIFKQGIKLIFKQDVHEARAITRGIFDYYRKNWGKITL